VSSSSALAPRKSERYHHGDLRHALLDAARVLAAEVGVDGFTLREVARRAGVSHAAPYHHFPDKAALVRALAIDAFRLLTARMLEAAESTAQPLERLERIGACYVRFALEHPVEFRFMFRRDLCLPDDAPNDALQDESLNAQAVLENAVKIAHGQGLLEGDVKLVSLSAWSGVHGLATLILDAPGFEHLPFETALGMTRDVISTLRLGFQKR
jgi:AcrR family transcriptional regulator